MNKLAIATPVGKETEEALTKMVEEVKAVCFSIGCLKNLKIIFSTDEYTLKESEEFVKKLSRKYSFVLANRVKIREKGQTFARTYLAGFERALREGAEMVIEMDVGSHNPGEIPTFVNGLREGNDCVFSTRFSLGGGFINYPKQRVFISKVSTFIANVCFGIFPPFPDLTSGFEAFSADFLKRLFKKTNLENWVCVRIVPHLIQTEIRVLALKSGAKFSFVPIKYGYNKKGKKFKLKYLILSLKGLLILIYSFYTGKCWSKKS